MSDEGQLLGAIRYCQAVVEEHPQSIEARRLLVRLYMAQAQPSLAVAVLESDACGQTPSLQIDFADALAAHGELPRAIAVLEDCATARPKDKALAMRLAELLIATGQSGRAKAILEPHSADSRARRLLALALLGCGEARDARRLFLELESSSPSAQTAHDMAITERELASGEAEHWMALSHARDPTDVQTMLGLGVMRLARGAAAEAQRLLREASDRQAESAVCHAYLALAFQKLGRKEEALEECELALHFDPALALGWYHYGLFEQEAGRHEPACSRLGRAVELDPQSAEAWAALGTSHYELGRYTEAADAYRHAVALKPASKKILSNLALAYRETGEFGRALACLESALKIDPQYVAAHSNLGLVAQDLGDIPRALDCFSQALKLDPGSEEARWFSAVVRLREGLYPQGWPDYENRWLSSTARKVPFHFPDWKGEHLANKTILVYAEQGLGDQIMFASCLSEMIEQAGLVALECSRKLEGLFARSFPKALVFGSTTSDSAAPQWLPRLPPVDLQVAIGSLPLHYRQQLSDFPRHSGYLRAEPARIAYWRARLENAGPGPYVGVSWQGGAAGTRRALRSLPLARFANLFRRLDAQYFSLQYTPCGQEIESLQADEGLSVHHWQEAIDDYDETAALVCALDLVISVCTSVIHLAGALGRPAVVLVPFAAEWRYGRTGSAMPWYPSVHLVRQTRPGDWEDVLERAEAKGRCLLTPPS